MKSTVTFLVIFGLFWSSITLLFDALVIGSAVRQVSALWYAQTEGTILSSKVTSNSDSEGGDTHGVALTYSYTVDGREYIGDRYRFNKFSSSDSRWAYEAVEARPPETRVTVFYNPSNPQTAVLLTGLDGGDMFLMTFMTPFNAVMLGFWWAGAAKLRLRWMNPAAGGVKVVNGLRSTRLRLTSYSPLVVAVSCAALCAFLSIFPIAFLCGGFHPSIATMRITWLLIGTITLTCTAWYSLRVASGKYDFVIDELENVVELPATQGRKERRRIPIREIQSIDIEMIAKPSSEGGTTYGYAPRLRLPDTRQERLAEWFDQDKAKAFAAWLQVKLGLPKRQIRN